MEIALDSVDTQSLEIEMNAEKLRAHDLISQFKADMNKEKGTVEESKPAAAKNMLDGIDQKDSSEQSGGAKTIGREKA